jgi:hypothetical protein
LAAALYGSKDEKLAAFAMSVAALISPFVLYREYGNVEYGVGIVDTGLLVALLAIALHSGKFWPMWATGFHLAGILVHVAAASTPLLPAAYATLLGIFGWMVVVSVFAGTVYENIRWRG